MGRRHEHSTLCYLEASRVQSPAGELADLDVVDRNEHRIGTLDGVLVDPVQRRLRYLVVGSDPNGSRRYLVPSESPAIIDEDAKVLRVELDSEDLAEYGELEQRGVRQFSDDDVIAALFGQPAA